MSTKPLQIIECPRDAMQGIKEFIPTETKAEYINSLLKLNFHTIDFGSFVSPKAIPQLRDTAKVLSLLNLDQSTSKLLAIVANNRGVTDAGSFEEIQYLGYPFSISNTFLERNINSNMDKAWHSLGEIQALCEKSGKTLVVYISMAFGNPYGDEWSSDLVTEWTQKLYREMGVKIVALSDTVGSSTPELIRDIFTQSLAEAPKDLTIGAHLHSTKDEALSKIEATWEAGCRRIDVAMGGFGGCPMAKKDLTGNMPTEIVMDFLSRVGAKPIFENDDWQLSQKLLNQVFTL